MNRRTVLGSALIGAAASAAAGVASAKPRVITGSDDATVNRNPPGKKEPRKDWDLNYDIRDTNEGKSRI